MIPHVQPKILCVQPFLIRRTVSQIMNLHDAVTGGHRRDNNTTRKRSYKGWNEEMVCIGRRRKELKLGLLSS